MTDRPRDWAQHLPLSNRPRHDERAVGFDWREELERLVELTGSTPQSDAALAQRRVGVRDYGAVLVEVYRAAPESDALRVLDAPTGAVALAQAQRAPFAVKAVIRGRTVRATDAGWEFGSGPVLEGSARQLLLFLYGRGPVPGS